MKPQTSIRRQDNGVIIIEPHGKIVGPKVAELREALSSEIKAFDTPLILINLEYATGMNSSGLGVLIYAYNSVKRKNGRMGVIHAGKHINNLLILSRLTSLFEHFENEKEAITGLEV